jgi:hypothetical protein
LCDVV